PAHCPGRDGELLAHLLSRQQRRALVTDQALQRDERIDVPRPAVLPGLEALGEFLDAKAESLLSRGEEQRQRRHRDALAWRSRSTLSRSYRRVPLAVRMAARCPSRASCRTRSGVMPKIRATSTEVMGAAAEGSSAMRVLLAVSALDGAQGRKVLGAGPMRPQDSANGSAPQENAGGGRPEYCHGYC